MSKIRNNKTLLKHLESTSEDSRFDPGQLSDEHFLNFQFEDQYGFGNHPNRGLIRKRIVELLFEIHDRWKVELEKLNKPYYLAIWLCEPQIIRSEVVCAIDERIERYTDHWFDQSTKDASIRTEAYGKSQDQLERFTWERKNLYDTHENVDYHWPKENYQNPKQFYKDQRFHSRIKKTASKISDGEYGKTYYQRIGDVWVGREKN
ncbi:hypothetical protein [Fluviicola taffensis]|uniref:hypothetical protein n=1 Tax=Fluviicola taffensis TaxID=191579 RepID=UPI003137761A